MRFPVESVRAFLDEMEKIAAGPLIIDIDDPRVTGGPRAYHVKPSVILNPTAEAHHTIRRMFPQAIDAAKKGRPVLLLPSVKNISTAIPDTSDAKATYKQLRRHEMTHWLRGRRGKMKGVSEPGLRNVLRTGREELAAHLSQVKTRGISEAQRKQIASLIFPGTWASVRGNYAYLGGPKKAALGGKLGALLRRLRIIR